MAEKKSSHKGSACAEFRVACLYENSGTCVCSTGVCKLIITRYVTGIRVKISLLSEKGIAERKTFYSPRQEKIHVGNIWLNIILMRPRTVFKVPDFSRTSKKLEKLRKAFEKENARARARRAEAARQRRARRNLQRKNPARTSRPTCLYDAGSDASTPEPFFSDISSEDEESRNAPAQAPPLTALVDLCSPAGPERSIHHETNNSVSVNQGSSAEPGHQPPTEM